MVGWETSRQPSPAADVSLPGLLKDTVMQKR